MTDEDLRRIKQLVESGRLRDENRQLTEQIEQADYAVVSGVLHVPHYQQAETWAGTVASALGIKCPDVSWFIPLEAAYPAGPRFLSTFKGARGLRGRYDVDQPNRIMVKATEDLRQTVETIAHELRHKWQVKTHGPPVDVEDVERRELDATAYAAEAVCWWDEHGAE